MNAPPAAAANVPYGRPLRLVFYAWLFGAFWANLVGGAAFNRFARALGASDAAFGLLAAIPYLAAAVQLPAGFIVERVGHRKRWFLTAGLIERGSWVVLAAVPWLLPQRIWWPAFLACYALAVTAQNIDGACWMSWMADLIPQRIRGRFVAGRSRLGQIMTLLLPLPIGWLLDHYGRLGDVQVRLAASLLLAIAGLVGLVDILMHLPVPEPTQPRPAAMPSFHRMMLQPLRDRNFRRFLGFNGTLVFSVGFLGQYFWLYCFDVLKTTTLQASLLLILLPVLVSLACTAFYGPLIDKLGRKPLILIGGLLILPGALGWFFMSRDHWMPGYLLVLFSGLGWPAVETGRFNILLGMGETRAGRGSGIAYIAINSLVIAISGVLSGCFGAVLAHRLGPSWHAMLCGWPMTYHHVLFLVSTVMRAAAMLWLIGFVEPRAFATRAAIRYVATAMVVELQTAVAAPFRVLSRIGSAAFKVGRR